MKIRKLLLIIFILSGLNLFAQIPSGYYNSAVGLSGENLRTALKTIISTGHVKLVYTPGVWNAYAFTDVRPAPNNTIIWDMYSDVPGGTAVYYYTFDIDKCGTANSEGDCYSREHCLPNSWWGGYDDAANPQYTDLHHLFPADQYVNGYKSAHPIGQVGSASFTSTNGSKVGSCSYPGYTGTVFEPINAYKGDFARAYLYMATRYKDNLGAWAKNFPSTEAAYIIDTATSNFKPWFINMMLAWHNADTVSPKEIDRNNAIYYNTGQHNRNPFVDHPEYVAGIWGGSQLIKQEPTNHATNFQATNTAPSNSTITVNWTDATGTVLPDGYLVRASSIGLSQIQNPVDSTAEITGNMQKIVVQGLQSATFSDLLPGTVYYFKIFPFTNSGSNINFKTDGIIPAASLTTSNYTWKEDFETGSKASYANGTVNCTMGSWTFSNALIGNSISDRKNDLQSARLLDANLYMNFNKTGGADTVWVYHGKYGSNGNSSWQLQISTDGGIVWNNIGNLISTTDTNLTAVAFAVKQTGNVRFNIQSYSNSNRLNIDDITISNFSGFTPPVLTADASNNNVDHNIDISFTDDATWRSAITAVKVNGATLTPTIDYTITTGNIQLKPSAGNPLLTAAGTKTITIEATAYINDTVVQQINAGAPTTNSTVSISSALAKNTSQTISCTAKDQYNNPVSAYSFKYDLVITNANPATTETYTIDGIARTATINNVNVVSLTNTNGIAIFSAAVPANVDANDGISIQLQLNDGTTNIGSAYQYTELYPQTISFGSLTAQTYGNANFSLTATASSGLVVSYTSSNPAIASISGNIVTILNVGSTNITASQAGNSTFYPASNVNQSLTINPKALTISGAVASDKIYNGSNAAVITGSLSGIIGSDVVTLNGSGVFADVNAANGITVSSTSTISGTDAYKYTLTQPIGLTANISKASQTISFGTIAAKTVNDADFSPGATSPTSGVNPITYTSSNSAVATIVSNLIHITGTGTSTITAAQSGNGNYNAATDVTQTLTVTSGSTTLLTGDIAIVAYQTDDPDMFAYILLKDVNANTSITFTDNTWTGSQLLNTEGSVTWTAPTGGLPKGTFIKIQGNTLTGGGSVSSNSMQLAVAGDQIIAYQGISSSPGFIAALSSSTYITTGSTNSNSSYIPQGLTNKINGICFSTEFDEGYYNGPTTGSISFLRAAINNPDNWLTSNAIQTWPSPWTFNNSTATVINQNISLQNLTIAANETMTVNNGFTLNVGGSVLIQSDANSTGSLIEKNGVNATVERYIANPDQYHMIAASVNGQTISTVISLSDSLYTWDETTASWVSFKESNFNTVNGGNTFVSGKGYALSCSTIQTKSFSGNLNNGIISIPLSLTSGTYSGWNFIANPYPSAINWNSTTGYSRNTLEDAGSGEHAFWLWNPASGNYGSYISNGVGTNGASRNIAPAQGFWVKASAAGILSMNDSVREHSNQNWLKANELTSNLLRISVNGNKNTFSDETVIFYGKSNSTGGAEKMYSMESSAPALYTKKYNKNWSINYLTSIIEHAAIPLSFKAGINGNYTLHFQGSENFSHLSLEDKLLNTHTNMLINSNYQFYADINDNYDRFTLHFSSISGNLNENDKTNTKIYAVNKEIIVSSDERIYQLFIYNNSGQLIDLMDGSGNYSVKFKTNNNSLYYYIVKVVTAKNVVIKKVITE